MRKKTSFFALMVLCVGLFSAHAQASLVVCQDGSCQKVLDQADFLPWLKKLHSYFKTPNARIDFCEAAAQKRSCLAEGLNWTAQSALVPVSFSTKVARTAPLKNTLLLDYLITANSTWPDCSYALTTFDKSSDNSIRMVSHAFECQLADFSKTHLQNSFFIDYINFDEGKIGAKYVIQINGAVNGQASGYAVMTFRDGNTLRPLIHQTNVADMPAPPSLAEARQIIRQHKLNNPNQQKSKWEIFSDGVKNWWGQLKDSLNLDLEKEPIEAKDEPSWWDKFTDKFMKIIYLEPLD